ncbi:hypothetical protein Taro_054071 [Colocasia esculenta]|uniref:Uncharacterized protein n=1 Tax=Colocasia esculenta TaxID=4460 RepID=A0A843XPL3_COLES|nr:hypothetical protein [Colocasia esculenta]
MRDLIPSSDSLDYANRWRRPHADPPSHSDRKSCSTRREISSPGHGYGCPNIADIVTPSGHGYGCPNIADIVTPYGLFPPPSAKELSITFRTGIGIAYLTTIRNRHSETVVRALASWNSVSGQKFPPRASDSLDYANRWRRPHADPPSHSDRRSCSTRREISSPGHGYGCPNIVDIVTPSAKELGITFRTGIGITYLTTIRNWHSKTDGRALVSQNSVPGPKFPS